MAEKKANQDEVFEIDVVSVMKALWKRIWLIAAVGIFSAAIAFEYTTLFIKPVYESSAMMYVNNGGVQAGSSGISINPSVLTGARSLVDSYSIILKSRSMLEKVIDEADLKSSDGKTMEYEELNGKVKVGAVNGTEIFRITVRDGNPDRAKLIANTIVSLLPYQISTIVEGSSVKTVDTAVRGVKIAPSRAKNTIVGFVCGVVAVSLVVAIIAIVNNYIEDEDYIIQNYDMPLLAVIPDLRRSTAEKYGKYGKYGKYRNYYGNYQSRGGRS